MALVGKVTEDNLVSLKNAKVPIDITLLGIEIPVNLEQPENARVPILVHDDTPEKSTPVKLKRLRNPEAGIFTTVDGKLTLNVANES